MLTLRSTYRRCSPNRISTQAHKLDMTLTAFNYLGVDLDQVNLGGLRITLTRYAPDQVQPWHSHQNANFHFLLGGAFLDESTEWGEYYPSTFSLVFHPAGSRHRTISGPKGRHGLNIEPDEPWLAAYGLCMPAMNAVQTRPAISLALAGLAMGAFAQEYMSDVIFESLFGLEGCYSESPGWFRKLESLIIDAEAVQWTVARLAAEVSVHPVYLARVFRSRYGTSVTAYLQQLRLLRGIRLLEDSNCLTSVAIEAGFADHAHFTRSFKAWFQITPSEARTQLKEVSNIQAFAHSLSNRI